MLTKNLATNYIVNTCEGEAVQTQIKSDDSGQIVVVFTITEINYLLVSVFCDVVLLFFCLYRPAGYQYLYLWYQVLLAALLALFSA